MRLSSEPAEEIYGDSGHTLEISVFFGKCRGHKRVFYYDDLISDPSTMLDLLEFLMIEPADGIMAPDQEFLERTWADAAAQSRANYAANQARSGGPMTKDNPLDFKFHQRGLSLFERRMVWDLLDRQLTPDEMALVNVYQLENAKRLTFLERLRTITFFF